MIKQLSKKLFDISSQADPSVLYRVNIEDSECECMAWQVGTTRPCKHLVRAKMWLANKKRKYEKS